MTNQPNPEVAALQAEIAKLREEHAACLREVREKLTSPEGTTVRDVLDALAIIDRIQGEKPHKFDQIPNECFCSVCGKYKEDHALEGK